MLYFIVASFGIVSSIAIPNLVRRIGSHATFFLGLIAMIISVVLLSSESTPVFVIGLPLHFLSVAAIEVPLNFYILSEVPRRELTRFEPLRILGAVLAYTVGPWLGVFLESRVDHMLPFVLAIGSTVVTMWHFGWLKLGDTGDALSTEPLVNPLRHVRRFFGQPRMRLAWALALARSSWWMTFMVYTPIYAELSGLGSLVGAGLVSIGTAWTFTVPLWGWVGRRYGLRPLLRGGFYATAALTMAVFVLAGQPLVAGMMLIWTALAASVLDGAGNVPFLRAVRPRERSEMIGVYLTFRDAGQLAPPGAFAILLKFFELPDRVCRGRNVDAVVSVAVPVRAEGDVDSPTMLRPLATSRSHR